MNSTRPLRFSSCSSSNGYPYSTRNGPRGSTISLRRPHSCRDQNEWTHRHPRHCPHQRKPRPDAHLPVGIRYSALRKNCLLPPFRRLRHSPHRLPRRRTGCGSLFVAAERVHAAQDRSRRGDAVAAVFHHIAALGMEVEYGFKNRARSGLYRQCI